MHLFFPDILRPRVKVRSQIVTYHHQTPMTRALDGHTHFTVPLKRLSFWVS